MLIIIFIKEIEITHEQHCKEDSVLKTIRAPLTILLLSPVPFYNSLSGKADIKLDSCGNDAEFFFFNLGLNKNLETHVIAYFSCLENIST